MALVVAGPRGDLDKFATATVWHIDEEGYLHIAEPTSNGNKTRPIASFAPGCWASVHADRMAVGPFGNADA